jgi:hypothetical protein
LNSSLASTIRAVTAIPQINFPAEPVDPVVAAEYAARGGNTVDFLAAQAELAGASMDQVSADRRAAEQDSVYGTIGPDSGLPNHLFEIGRAWLNGDLNTGEAISMALDNTAYAYKNSDTAQGLVQISGGIAEVAGAVAITAASGGPGAVIGVPVAFHGGDDIGTGFNRIGYQEPQNTLTYNTVDALTGSPAAARAVDIGIPLMGAVAGAAATVESLSVVESSEQNWGTGPLRPPARVPLENEDILIDESQGLQSRQSGTFDNVVTGDHGDPATRYLFTVDERGVNIALEQTPFPTPRGNIVHSNISSEASMGGEAWFGPDNSVTINAGSGRFGYNSGAQPFQWDATVKLWQSLGYEVTPLPFNAR